jgi:hypothetical protein
MKDIINIVNTLIEQSNCNIYRFDNNYALPVLPSKAKTLIEIVGFIFSNFRTLHGTVAGNISPSVFISCLNF